MNGIYTLANDKVYDQLVAFLNSVEANVGPDLPVCIIPYDDNLERVKAEIANRPSVTLFDDQKSIERWDRFTQKIWDLHPIAKKFWYKDQLTSSPNDYYRLTMRRKFCAFDGPFDKFIFFDADILVFDKLDYIFDRLDENDWVVYDFLFRQPDQAFNLREVQKQNLFTEEQLQKVFCAGFFASQKGFFDDAEMETLLGYLRSGEISVLVPRIPDQTITNYMAIRPGRSICNLAQALPAEKRPGNCVTSDHFQDIDHVLYDRGLRLTYIHFICVSSNVLTRVAEGENIGFPYRDVYLHYRFLKEPEKTPAFPPGEPPVTYRDLKRKKRYRPSPLPWVSDDLYRRTGWVGEKIATLLGR